MSENNSLIEKKNQDRLGLTFDSFILFIKLPRDMHISNILAMITIWTSNVAFYAFMIYLIEVWEVSDTLAGVISMTTGIGMIISRFFTGGIIDYFGIINSCVISSGVIVIGFLGIAWIDILWIQLFFIIGPTLVSRAVLIAATSLAINVLVTPDTKSISFSITICIRQLAALIFGLVYQLITYTIGVNKDSFRFLYTLTAAINVVMLLLSLTLDKEKLGIRKINNEKLIQTNPFYSLIEAAKYKRLWRVIILICLLSFAMATFYQATFALPIYMERELNGSEADAYGYMLALRSILCAIFCLSSTIFVYYFEIYDSMTLASLITVSSVLFFAIGNSIWIVMVYILIISLGNSILEPRSMEYIMDKTLPGKESIFMNIALLAFPFAIVIAGISSGILLENYCPEDGERECWKMWYIIGGINAVATAILFVGKKWLYQPFSQEELEPYIVENR